jgi:hypothetical protein
MSHPSSRFTRRAFVRGAAAALAAPLVLASRTLGLGGTPPSERVTMGFIGIGGQGGGHLTGGAWTYLPGGYLGRDDVQVLAACDVARSRRDRARDRCNEHYAQRDGKGSANVCTGYVDFRDVLARDDVQAVLIATPIHWHAIQSVMAARAGKDVYCEKPTAVTVAEARAVRDAVRRYGRVYQGGTQQRSEYGGKFRQACQLVRSGRIGTLKEVYACCQGGGVSLLRFGAPQPVPDELDWDLWLGPAPNMPYDGNWGAHRFETGGLNWGQHHYDIVQWALDADRTGPVELDVAEGAAVYRFASGVTVYGRGYPGEKVGGTGGAVFVGTQGRIAVDRGALVSEPARIVREPLRPDDVHLYHADSHSGNFLDCIRTRKATIVDADTACRAATFLLLGGIVQELGRRLTWDPAAERFVGDDEANRLLALAQRPPWQI